jgi:GTP cyclohydrolase I
MLIQLCSTKTQYQVKNKLHLIPQTVKESDYNTEELLTIHNINFYSICKRAFLFTGRMISNAGKMFSKANI